MDADLLESLDWDFVRGDGPDLLARWASHHRFARAMESAGLTGDARGAATRGPLAGLDLATPDHLGLAAHPAIRAAAVEALHRWGTGASDDGPALGLEARLAALLGCAEVATFSSGWSAASAALRLLVRESDHVVLDSLAGPSPWDGAAAAQLHRTPHLSAEAVETRLADIRARDARCGILVVTDSLFALDAGTPDLRALRTACLRHGATLLVDVSHDLGAVGGDGRGAVGEAGLAGGLDVAVGSFRRVLGATGGFVACRDAGLGSALRGLGRRVGGDGGARDALPPLAAATAAAALDVVVSPEGASRRGALLRNAVALRGALTVGGLGVLGRPGPVVPVDLGSLARGRVLTRAVRALGAAVNLIEHPVVSRHMSRWCLQVSSEHDAKALVRFAASAGSLAGGGEAR